MKSQLLSRQLREIFGDHGEAALRDMLTAAQSQSPALAVGIDRLLASVDATYAQYAGLQQGQAEISGDTYSDWNLKTGRIESGRQWKALLGYAENEVDSSLVAWRSLIHPDDHTALQANIARHVQGEERTFSAECRMKARNGQWRWMLLKGRVNARESSGEPARLLVMHRDISAAKDTELALTAAKEAAEAASKARGAFLANMSHEIRTPMNGIIGMTELALDTSLDAEQKHYLKTVKSSAESLLHIVNEILDFSKIEAGKLQVEKIAFALRDTLYDAVRVLCVAAHKKGLEVIVDIAPDVPARVVGDPMRLRQVITNLLGNAVKFTERGEVALEVKLLANDDMAATLQFTLRDTGIGIAADKQQVIFNAFSQADVSTTRRFGGTGLGLAICRRLVQMMEGRLWLDSREGEGTRFHFTIRFGVEAAAMPVPPGGLSGKRALVVEDNPFVARQLAGYLRQLGVDAKEMQEGTAALAAVEHARRTGEPYHFVIVDSMMETPGGFDLAELRKGAGPEEKLLVMLTTENQRRELERLRRLETGAHLVKPVGIEDLIEALAVVNADGLASAGALELDAFDLGTGAQTAPSTNADVLDVLVVEDNPINQELAAKLLQKRGHHVVIANNGAEAVDQFETGSFDVVFMDLQMPVMGGIEATEAIRAREMRRSWVASQDLRAVYIAAMTANILDSDREQCRQAGMDDFIAKPLRPVDLDAVLTRMREQRDTMVLGQYLAGEPTDAQIFDRDAALQSLGDHELLVNMANMLLREWDEHLSRLRQAVTDGEPAELRMQAHTLKSLLAIFHAERARRVALELEKSAQAAGNETGLLSRGLFEELLAEMAALKPEIERFAQSK